MSDHFCMLGRVASGVAHDLANYLGAVDLALTIADRGAGTPTAGRALVNAREATQRALKLTRSLLDYARGGTPQAGPVDLAGTVRAVLELFGRTVPDRLTVSVDLQGGLPPITAVAPEVEQLVLNLILNACEAMPDGGTLTIHVRQAGDGIALVVGDTGRGLGELPVDAGVLSPSTKPHRTGGGLGLGIVRRVAARHAARVKFSANPGGGSNVLVVFPADEVAARRALGEALAPAGGSDVLVIDDDEEIRTFFGELLRSQGFTVHTAENGRSALEWLDAQPRPPACIVLDLEMPVMDGWDFMKSLRGRHEVPPVVVVSGAVDPPDGAIVYLSKPPPIDRLIRAVQACCAEPESAACCDPPDVLVRNGSAAVH
jgi:CheY-like chemotaxis protein